MTQVKAVLDDVLDEARHLNPEDFLQASKNQERVVTEALCALYREGKLREATKSLSLKNIIVKGMDDEQIFQQMRVLEEPIVDHIERMTRNLDESTTEEDQLAWASQVKKTMFPDALLKEQAKSKKSKSTEQKTKKDKKKAKVIDEVDEEEEAKNKKKRKNDDDEHDDDKIMYKDFFGDEGLDDDDEVNKMLFDEEKQQELEELLDQHDSDIDLNADIDDDDGENIDDDEPLEVFDEDKFDDSVFESKPEEESEEGEEEDDEEQNDEDDEDENDHLDEDGMMNEENEEKKKTSHEEEQEILKKRIEKLEDANVADKPWTLAGEVSVADRPVDSLLDTYVEFQTGKHGPPVVSPAATAELTKIIQKRIADGTWDDIAPRTLDDSSSKPRAEKLSPEEEARRAKMGLGEVYEEEYRKQMEKMAEKSGALLQDDSKLTPQQEALEHELDNICRELDILSNFNFTPSISKKKGADEDEVKVLPNAPSIAMEEIVPMAVSSSTLLAPEEVYNAKDTALKKTAEEMTREERRASRNARKREIRSANAGSKSSEESSAPGDVISLASAGARLKRGKTASSITGSNDALSTARKYRSKSFFTALQHEQSGGGYAPPKKKSRDSSGSSSSSVKL